MDEQTSPLEAKLELLAGRVAAIERRLEQLTLQASATPGLAPVGAGDARPPVAESRPVGADTPDVGAVVALIGRTLFILAGAFLLRALTDSERLDAGLGVLLGLAFAVTWIVTTDRAAARGHGWSAAFHGLAFVLIAYPLVFEATSRFHFLNAASAAAGLAGCTAIALAVSWRRRLQVLAWVATAGALVTAAAVVVVTAELGPVTFFLVLLGVATLWLGYAFEWTLLRWPVAFLADLAVLILALRAVAPAASDTPGIAFSAQVVLLVAYLGSFATRTLVLNRNVVPFEVVQSIAAILAGLGGAAYLTQATHSGGLLLGAATLALALGCYGAAAIFVERRQSRRRNYYFYTSAALVFVLTGVALTVPSQTAGLVFAVFGLAAAIAGRLSGRFTYRSHGMAYLMAGVLATGLTPYVLYGLGLPFVPAGKPSSTMLLVLVLCAAALWGLDPGGAVTSKARQRAVPRLIVVGLVLGGLLGMIVSWTVAPVGSPGAPAPGLLATERTALLVAGILTIAVASRAAALVEGAWLVYPLLVLTGLKFVLEDLRAGQPGTLFVGFALFGLALIAGPRLCRRPSIDASVAEPGRPPG